MGTTDLAETIRLAATQESLWPSICCGLIGFGIAYGVILATIRLWRRRLIARRARDPHHTHRVSVPRIGGLGVFAGFAAIVLWLWLFQPHPPMQVTAIPLKLALLVAGLAMFLVGFIDDFKPLGAKRKLVLQLMASLLAYGLGFRIETLQIPGLGSPYWLGWMDLPVTLLWLVGLTNLVNLIDGVDGLAGGICLMLMVLLAFVGAGTNLAFLSMGMAGVLLAFLRFNFPPARIFLGDGGAYFLGFLIGLLTIASSHKGTVVAALIAPLFVLALPILDTSLAILRRGSKGLPIFRPDRRHIHHRLMASGLSRRKMVFGLYFFTLVFLVLGFLAFASQGRLLPVLTGVSLAIILGCAGWLSFSREWFSVGKVLANSVEMRRDIRYALQLTRWLEMEAARSPAAESLFWDFVFVLRKLGFCSAKLTLYGNEWIWEAPEAETASVKEKHPIHLSSDGSLELGIPTGLAGAKSEPGEDADPGGNDRSTELSVRLQSILSELAVEGWTKAVRLWEDSNRCRFLLDAESEAVPGAVKHVAHENGAKVAKKYFLPKVVFPGSRATLRP